MLYKKNLIKLSDSFSVLCEEVPDGKKKYIFDDNENEEKTLEEETLFNNSNYKSCNQLFD